MTVFDDAFRSLKVDGWATLDWQAPRRSKRVDGAAKGVDIRTLIARFLVASGLAATAFTSTAGLAAAASTTAVHSQLATALQQSVVPTFDTVTATTLSVHLGQGNIRSPSILTLEESFHEDGIVSSVEATTQELSVGVGGQSLELGPQTSALISPDGVARIRAFAELEPGWDAGRGIGLKSKSVAAFETFFSIGDFHPQDVSVFMSTDGNLIANWLLDGDQQVELEFHDLGISYFNEKTGDEFSVARQRFGEFRSYLERHASNS